MDAQRFNEFIEFNTNSFMLMAAAAIISGPLFAITHEITMWVIRKFKAK